MTAWLFDLGNTRLKCAPLHVDGSIGETLAIAHDDGADWLEALDTSGFEGASSSLLTQSKTCASSAQGSCSVSAARANTKARAN